METCVWAFVALIGQPILLAGGDLLLKQMGRLPEEPCSFFQGITLGVFAGSYMIFAGESFGFILELNTMAWACLIAMCILTVLGQILKKRAVDCYDVSQLQKANNMSSFWQFLVDLIILQVAFSGMQYMGFLLLFAIFVFEIARIYQHV